MNTAPLHKLCGRGGTGMLDRPPRTSAVGSGELVRAGAAMRLRIVGHPLRLRLIELLAQRRAATVGQLAALAGASATTTSKHLRELARVGLVVRTQDGNFAQYALADPAVGRLVATAYRLVARDARHLVMTAAPLTDGIRASERCC